MSRWLREYRILPVVLIAAGCLFALKAMGLMFDGGYTLGQRLSRGETLTVTTLPASPATQLQPQTSQMEFAGARPPGQKSWMQEVFNYPDVTGSVASRPGSRDSTIITGSVGSAAKKDTPPAQNPAAPPAEAKSAAATPPPADLARPDATRPSSAAERAILERLHQRRQELDARAREIEIRENLLKAAEKKIEDRIAVLKAAEAQAAAGQQKKEDAEAARFKSLVTVYETMKPRDAAKIFDRLDSRVLLQVATQIKPARMSEIMAQMSPEAAEKLTIDLAAPPGGLDKAPNPNDLPKIDGRPSGG